MTNKREWKQVIVVFYAHGLYLLWFNYISFVQYFNFPLFLCMVMYDNEFKTKENKHCTKQKIEPEHTVLWRSGGHVMSAWHLV